MGKGLKWRKVPNLHHAAVVDEALKHIKAIAQSADEEQRQAGDSQTSSEATLSDPRVLEFEAKRVDCTNSLRENQRKRSEIVTHGGATAAQGNALYNEWVSIQEARLSLAMEEVFLFTRLLDARKIAIDPSPEHEMVVEGLAWAPKGSDPAAQCTGCRAYLVPTAATDESPDFCDCCERMVPCTSIKSVRSNDGYSCCNGCANTRSLSIGHYEENLDFRPDSDLIESLCELANTLKWGVPQENDTDPQHSAARDEAERWRVRRELLEDSQHDALISGKVSVSVSQDFYNQQVVVDRGCLDALEKLNRILVEAIVAVQCSTPRQFCELIMALYASGDAPPPPPQVQAMLERQLSQIRDFLQMPSARPTVPFPEPVPFPKEELVSVECDNCNALVPPTTLGSSVDELQCDCCLRIMSYRYGPTHTRNRETGISICETCSQSGDPVAVAQVASQPRKLPDQTTIAQVAGDLGTLRAAVKRQVGDQAAPQPRAQAEAAVTAVKLDRLSLKNRHRAAVSGRTGPVPIPISRQLYKDRVDVENRHVVAMATLVRVLVEEAADRQIVIPGENAPEIIKRAYEDGVEMPEKVKLLVNMSTKVSVKNTKASITRERATEPPVTCDGCASALHAQPHGKGPVGWCDCCKRCLLESMVAKTVLHSSGTAVVAFFRECEPAITATRGAAGIDDLPKTRIPTVWLHRATSVATTLRSMLQRASGSNASPSASSSGVPGDPRLLSAEQEVVVWQTRIDDLKTKVRKAVRGNGKMSVTLSRTLNSEEISTSEGMLDALKELIQIFVETMREKRLEIPKKVKPLVTKICNGDVDQQPEVQHVPRSSTNTGGGNQKRSRSERSRSRSRERQPPSREWDQARHPSYDRYAAHDSRARGCGFDDRRDWRREEERGGYRDDERRYQSRDYDEYGRARSSENYERPTKRNRSDDENKSRYDGGDRSGRY